MEFEKTLFRIHQRILTKSYTKEVLKWCFLSFFGLTAFTLVFFLYASFAFNNKAGCLGTSLSQYLTLIKINHNLSDYKLEPDTVLHIKICDYDDVNLQKYQIKQIQNKSLMISNNNLTLDNNKRLLSSDDEESEETNKEKYMKQVPEFCLNNEYQIAFEFSSVHQIITYPLDSRLNRNVTIIPIDIMPSCYYSNFLTKFIVENIIGLEPILINEIINSLKQNSIDLYMKNLDTLEMWSWSKESLQKYFNEGLFSSILNKIFTTIRIVFGLFIVSVVTGIYLKVTIICAPMFILLILECMGRLGGNQISRQILYRAFPWIGIYLYTLDVNNQRPIKHLVRSFLLLILLFYFIYLSSIFLCSTILFYKSIPKSLDENFFGFIAFLEFGVLLFIRTRSSIKWLPRVTLTVMFTFIYYIQFTAYGYGYLALYCLLFFLSGFFSYVLFMFEVPAMTWNPSYHYTPSLDRPRTLYLPLFNQNWYYDLPQFWTIFYPLHGRSYFSAAQMSLVDRNFGLLHNHLQQQNAGAAANQIGGQDAFNINEVNQQQQQPPAQQAQQGDDVHPQVQQVQNRNSNSQSVEMNNVNNLGNNSNNNSGERLQNSSLQDQLVIPIINNSNNNINNDFKNKNKNSVINSDANNHNEGQYKRLNEEQ